MSEPEENKPFDCKACNKNHSYCPICGCLVPGFCKKHSTDVHTCDEGKLRRMDAARRSAETMLEEYGTAGPMTRSYGQVLSDGFAMMEMGDQP